MAEVMDENTRRYYLDAMGIQCWESLDAKPLDENESGSLVSETGNRDVATSYADMENSVRSCTNCALQKTRKQAMPGRGNTSAKLMFVLLSPNEADENNDLLCSGEAGELFSKMLAAININIDDVYITSLLKCNVPASHTVSADEIQSCSYFLKQQIQFIRPEFVVVLGEATARGLLQKELSIDDSRAMNATLSQQLDSVPLFFSYSPDDLLTQPENKRKAWTDLQQLQKMLENNN